jgi:SPX domain protein involved in polyphosphate accumulation
MAEQMTFARKEVKFLVTKEQRDELLGFLLSTCMIEDEHGESTVMSLYYDTPSWQVARRCQDKPAYKEKIRVRRYGESADPDPDVFIELKKKFKGVTYKRRFDASLNCGNAILFGDSDASTQIQRELACAAARYDGLRPAMMVSCERIALYGRDDREFRMTFDTNLRCRLDSLDFSSSEGTAIADPDTCIMEVKVPEAFPLWLIRKLDEMGIRQCSFSKFVKGYEKLACGAAGTDTDKPYHSRKGNARTLRLVHGGPGFARTRLQRNVAAAVAY